MKNLKELEKLQNELMKEEHKLLKAENHLNYLESIQNCIDKSVEELPKEMQDMLKKQICTPMLDDIHSNEKKLEFLKRNNGLTTLDFECGLSVVAKINIEENSSECITSDIEFPSEYKLYDTGIGEAINDYGDYIAAIEDRIEELEDKIDDMQE